MAQIDKDDGGYRRFKASLDAGTLSRFYIFHGEERYLLERSLGEIRRTLFPGGPGGFDYKRFEGRHVSANLLNDAVNALPVFAKTTLIEIHDFDIFKSDEKELLAGIIEDLPDYVCVVLYFDTIIYKPDGRVKADAGIIKNAEVIEFRTQEQSRLLKWIVAHFDAAGKKISFADAEYLVDVTGGYMAPLLGEIGKVAAYAGGGAVERSDIDAVVTPALDTVAYKLAEALARRDHATALRILDELFQMREAPQKIIYSISLKMRQLLAARVCVGYGQGKTELMAICSLRYDFQARLLLETARKMSLKECRDAVLFCADAALDLNSAPEPQARLIELVLHLANN